MLIKCKFSDPLDLPLTSHCSAFSQIGKNTCQCNKGQPFPTKYKHYFKKYLFSDCLCAVFFARAKWFCLSYFQLLFFSLPCRQMRITSMLLVRYEIHHNLIQDGDGNERPGDISG